MSQRRCMGCMNITENIVCEKCGCPENIQNKPHQLPVGTMLQGHYQVGRVLGQGGFGITYLGWDTYLDIPVAIKEFYPSSLVHRDVRQTFSVQCYVAASKPAFDNGIARFLREAKALAKFENHPAIVRIKSLFTENNTAYIVMEYIPGTSLQEYVAIRGGRISLEETLRILRPVIEALEEVHQTGMVHRDISPDNIMLHPKNGAKLLDFGAIRNVEHPDPKTPFTQPTMAIVKHGFAPMEQYQGKESLGPWTDVYALCATIYYCVTGQIPPDAPTRFSGVGKMDWAGIPGITMRQRNALENGSRLQSDARIKSVAELKRGLYLPSEDRADYGSIDNNFTIKIDPEPICADSDARNEHDELREKQLQEEMLKREQEEQQKRIQEEKWRREQEGNRKAKNNTLLTVLLVIVVAVVCFFSIHVWQAPTCDKDGVCVICGRIGEKKFGHSWKPATCTTPRTCITCGDTSGSALGHNWIEATCTSPKTCRTCGKTEGSYSGHSWRPATYYQPETCSNCGQTRGTVKGYIDSMSGSWDTFNPSGYYTWCYIFDKKLEKCRGFTLDLTAEADYGNVDGYWKVFYRTTNNVWVLVDGINLKNGAGTRTYTFDPEVEVNAVAVVLANGASISYSFGLTVKDLYYFD